MKSIIFRLFWNRSFSEMPHLSELIFWIVINDTHNNWLEKILSGSSFLKVIIFSLISGPRDYLI